MTILDVALYAIKPGPTNTIIIIIISVPAILREAIPSTIDNVQVEYDNIISVIFEYTGKFL